MELEALLERVLSLGEEGDWAGAAEILREHLDDFDEAPAVHCWLGVAERELGLDGIAYERFKRALALEPTDPYVLSTAGNAIAAFDDPEAEQALRTAAVTAPQIGVCRLLYGAYLAREGLLDEAETELLAARDLSGEDPQVHYELGVLRGLQGRYDEAADALADAVRLAPDDAWLRGVFGLLLLESDRPVEAAGELAEAAYLDETDVEMQLAAALATASAGSEDKALELVERARIRASDADLRLVTAVEERVDLGVEPARTLLVENLAPSMLRDRLRQRA